MDLSRFEDAAPPKVDAPLESRKVLRLAGAEIVEDADFLAAGNELLDQVRMIQKMGHSDHLVIWFTDTQPGTTKASQSMEAMAVMDEWVANIRANPSGVKDFILTDAKDADMATGLAATGKYPETGKPRSLGEYRD